MSRMTIVEERTYDLPDRVTALETKDELDDKSDNRRSDIRIGVTVGGIVLLFEIVAKIATHYLGG